MRKRILEEKIKLIPIMSCLLTMVFAFILCMIWLFCPSLKVLATNVIKFNSGLNILFAAISVFLLKDPFGAANRRRYVFGKILAFGIFLIGLLTGIQDLVGVNFGIDEFFVKDLAAVKNLFIPGRMSPIAAICFVFLGLALMCQDHFSKKAKIHYTSIFLAPTLLLSFQALLGYLYGVSTLYQIEPFVQISWQSATCFQLLVI